jgi:hypothetical protein
MMSENGTLSESGTAIMDIPEPHLPPVHRTHENDRGNHHEFLPHINQHCDRRPFSTNRR